MLLILPYSTSGTNEGHLVNLIFNHVQFNFNFQRISKREKRMEKLETSLRSHI